MRKMKTQQGRPHSLTHGMDIRTIGPLKHPENCAQKGEFEKKGSGIKILTRTRTELKY